MLSGGERMKANKKKKTNFNTKNIYASILLFI